jgi:dTMP kinase
MNSKRLGRFITFEGPEGGGKTTQAKRLIARLVEQGHEALYTREPGGTPTGEAIREILQYDKAGEPLCDETEVFLFAASRAQLVRTVIIPALERGVHVVCDRFADSTTVYQGYGRGFDIDQMLAINAFAIRGATPDITLLLDVEVAVGFDRIASRQRELFQKTDRIENEARAFHERVRAGYLELAAKNPDRFTTLNAMRDPAEVEQDVWNCVQRVLV